jgi:hypothetical protein
MSDKLECWISGIRSTFACSTQDVSDQAMVGEVYRRDQAKPSLSKSKIHCSIS